MLSNEGFAELNEGEKGEVIVLMNETDSSDTYANTTRITRFKADGSIVWSNSYNGRCKLLQHYSNIYNNNIIYLWLYNRANIETKCFFNDPDNSLVAFQINYTTGLFAGYKSFCRQFPALADLYLVQGEDNTFTKILPNKNTVNILVSNTGTLLINVFDANLNCIKSKLFSPPIWHPIHEKPIYTFDISDNGEVAFSFNVNYGFGLISKYMPFVPLILLDANLNIKQEYIFQPPDNFASLYHHKFTPSGNIAFLAYDYLNVDPPFISSTIVTMPTTTKPAAICYARDTLIGSFSNYGLVANDGDTFKWDKIISDIYSDDGSPNFTISSLPILQTTTCNNISICDTLKIHGDAAYYLSAYTLVFSAYKNPQCQRNINWQTDDAFATIIKATNDTTIKLLLKKAGSFWLYAAVNNCVIKDSLKIVVTAPKQIFTINKDKLLCPGKNILLQASTGFATYQWQNKSTQNNFLVQQPGLYKVSARDSCGNLFSDSVTITLIATSFSVTPKQTICKGDTVIIPLPQNITSINWLPLNCISLAANQLFVYPAQTTNYTLNVIKYLNCEIGRTAEIIVQNCPQNIFFPNTFTPNNDNLTDVFKPAVSMPLKYYRLIIYNRYGQVMFSSNSTANGWDGNFKNTPQGTGTYLYKCSYQFNNNTVQNKTGTCLLVR